MAHRDHANMSYPDFYNQCRTIAEDSSRQGRDYLDAHSLRLYHTFKICGALVKPGSRVLSVGAGSAYVEVLMRSILEADVTVVDFPEAINSHSKLYSRYGFRGIGLDLSTDWFIAGPIHFDTILCCEIVEHLPVPPSIHFQALARYLVSGGYVIVSTPNLGRFLNIWRLLRGAPIFQRPELTFSTIGYSHEDVHRREYLAREIIDAVAQAGLHHVRTCYTRNNALPLFRVRNVFARLIEGMNPKFKSTTLIVAQKLNP